MGLRKKLYKQKQEEGIRFVYGIGHKKPALQKSVEALEEMIDKFKEYIKKLHVCGDRNSYSKTDPDATFMSFRRYLSRGNENVLAESILVAMARNINKLHAKIQSGRTGTHLYPLKAS